MFVETMILVTILIVIALIIAYQFFPPMGGWKILYEKYHMIPQEKLLLKMTSVMVNYNRCPAYIFLADDSVIIRIRSTNKYISIPVSDMNITNKKFGFFIIVELPGLTNVAFGLRKSDVDLIKVNR